MAPARVINTDGVDLPSLKVFADGKELGGDFGVVSITVTKTVNKISTARVVLLDGDTSIEDFELSTSGDFVPGNEMEIQAGYDTKDESIFKGIIIKHGIRSKGNKTSLLILDLKDVSVKMTVGRKNKYFEEVTDSAIIEELIGDYSDLTKDVEATDLEHAEMVQYFTSDWDFMISRADVNGQLVFVDAGKITVKAPDFKQGSALELFYGQNVFEFEAEIDARDQYTAIKSTSWDYAKQDIIEGEGAPPDVEEHGNLTGSELADVIGLEELPLQHGGQVIDQELKVWSDAKLLRSRLSKVRGRVKIQGFNNLNPGDLVELGGFGDRFNGIAFVSSISHHVNESSNWFTDVEFGLSQEWYAHRYEDIIDEPAAGLVPAIQGLHQGVVTNMFDDPDGEERVRVRIPVISTEDDGVWARVATLDAGDGRGSFFRPEVEDEVIVGFLNDDPRDAVILGMVHSSAKPAPLTAEEDNNQKGFITRSELKLIFDDDLNSITLETPNGNIITLSDDEGSIVLEDENSNKIEMISDGINLTSDGDINITAGGDVTIEGTNVTNTASSQLLVEGSSGAELSSAGQAVIKGATVGIN